MGTQGIWVFSETKETAFEMLGEARRLAGELNIPVTALYVGEENEAAEYFAYGADAAYALTIKEGTVPLEACGEAIAELAAEKQPQLVMISATKRGKTIAAIVAARLDSGCSTECSALTVSDGKIQSERMTIGGLAISTDKFISGTAVVTVGAKTYEIPDKDDSRTGTVETVEITGMAGMKVLERQPKAAGTVNLDEADIVFCVGRGVQKQEDLEMINELAEIMGASVGCTRPVAEDNGWFPEDLYIGISGQTVKPQLYISIGSSGQIQHVVGCRDSKVVVGIEKVEEAPIFEASDYGLVGDLYDFIPEMIKQLKK